VIPRRRYAIFDLPFHSDIMIQVILVVAVLIHWIDDRCCTLFEEFRPAFHRQCLKILMSSRIFAMVKHLTAMSHGKKYCLQQK